MATFEAQVEALTSLAITGSSTPTQTELTQFLRDGVLEVTTKWLMVSPPDVNLFARTSGEHTSNSSSPFADEAELIAVLREDGTNDQWRFCREIPLALESRITDSESIFFASKYNPAYTRNSGGVIKVFPEPTSGGANSYKVIYVNAQPKENDEDTDLVFGSSSIGFFPAKLVNLVVMFAAIKCLEARISSYTVDDEDSELVTSLSTSYNALKAQYDAYFGIQAKQMQAPQQAAPEESGQRRYREEE